MTPISTPDRRLLETAELGADLVARTPGAGLLIVDVDLRIQAIDGELYSRLGYEDAVGRPVPDVIPAAAWKVLEPRYRAALAGEPQSFEYDAISDESVYSLRLAPIRDESLVVGLLVLSEDITAKMRSLDGPVTADALGEIRRLAKEQERLRAAHEVARLASWELDPATDQVQVFQALPGDEGSVGATITFEDLLRDRDPEERQQMRDDLTAVRHGKIEDSVRRSVRRRPGGTVWLETRSRAVRDHDGVLLCVRGTTQDVTELEMARQEAATQAELLDEVDVAVIAADPEGVITHWNRGAERLYGWTRDEAVGRDGVELISPSDPTELLRFRGREGEEGQIVVRRKDGSTFPASLRSRTMVDAAGVSTGRINVSTDVSERVAAERALLSARDYLQAVADSLGEGLLTTDTDGRVTYINAAAEQLLGWPSEDLLGRSLHEAVHPRSARYSPPCEDGCVLGAPVGGQTVRVEDALFACRDGRPLPVSYTTSSFETEEGVQGGIVVFEETSERKAHEEELTREAAKLKWISRIQDALAEDRFMLYAQPIVDLLTDEVTRHELLLRMRAPDGTVVPPCEYLPVAEQYGLIADIDRWVIGQGATIAASGSPVQINLSARSIGDETVLDHIEACLQGAGADPADVVFEITETAILGVDEALARAFVNRLRALGCTIALDDFGTGYGGFTYVKEFPIDLLKIDMQFVRDLMTSAGSRHVVKAVVSLAEDFDLQTVGEGVEDAETYELLRDLGVDFAQGFHIARPGPLDEMLPGRPTGKAPARREPPAPVAAPLGTAATESEEAAILVVDDDPAKRLAISASLEPLGYAVVAVDSGEAALREITMRPFATIIMDVKMPVMDGYQATRLIRLREDAEHTPVIFVTAHTPDEVAVPTAYETGAVDFLFAPLDPDMLRAKVKIFADLFERSQKLERSLRDANEGELRLEAARSLSELGSWEWTPETNRFTCSESLADALIQDGLAPPATLEQYAALVHPEDRAGWERAVRRARGGTAAETEYRIPRLDGTDRWLLGRRAGSIGADGIERVHSVVRDISSRRALEEEMQETANQDPLTGLSNRRGFEYDFERTLAYASRYGRSGAVLVIDLDGFKAVNDALGHQAGDDLLLGIAASLRDRLRDSDLIGRLGGDEFVVVLAEVGADEAARVAGELRELVRDQGLAASRDHVATASVGVALFDGASDQRALLNRADQAMYEAKRDGGDRVAIRAGAPDPAP